MVTEQGRTKTVEPPLPAETDRRKDPAGRRPRKGARVLIIVQNLSVPFDRRVWLECRSLIDAGFEVAVVCPKGPWRPRLCPAL